MSMRFDLEFLPMVSTAAGVLAGLDLKHRCIVVDHLTIGRVNPAQWDQVFLLAAETTFKIRPEMEMIGDKLVVIATSKEPGLNRWPYVFFPHWLTMIKPSQRPSIEERKNEFFYDALLGRAKDPRTRLLQELEKLNLLGQGMISYCPGGFYGPNINLDASTYHSSIWEYEDQEIRDIYGTDLNYNLVKDSTTRTLDGYFSSCRIPTKVYARSAVSLVAETDNIGDHVFVTEKTWKPMIAGRIAVIYATPAHEDFLEELGFWFPSKTRGDPAKAAKAMEDLYLNTDPMQASRRIETIQNRRLADPQRWISMLYSWLDRNVRH